MNKNPKKKKSTTGASPKKETKKPDEPKVSDDTITRAKAPLSNDECPMETKTTAETKTTTKTNEKNRSKADEPGVVKVVL